MYLFSPIVSFTGLQQPGDCSPAHGWYEFDLAFMRRCQQLAVLQLPGWDDSIGIALEIGAAIALELPIEYIGPDQFPTMVTPDVLRVLNGP